MSADKTVMPDEVARSWYRDGYMVSTNRSLVQLDALNAALDSDVLWWSQALPEEALRKMVNHSLCIAVYALPDSTSAIAGKSTPQMVGFGRLVTDYVSVGYLTDVYVLPAHQGKRLGHWMMECLHEELQAWPELRRVLLISSSLQGNRMYEKTLGAREWSESTNGLFIMQATGDGVRAKPQ
ncbi:conserved hypothetical protein [Verticillium alfalfae VaMs.102]|uniref:N-acetyltransferase domain-containing protein n=1 Tax=Verticillium alfalfae (strain VaMs.102 / ATCC MYA-4576 / FGSC 10136) TaxID=526221 RepID=C9SSJ4_VERA1|nr:conserved hypothetical protein [Verticillium alfalfae VaMs.102]EEY21759.1 conserved hypothetical protein [Verticillium alfalfae VaMs.102]